MDAKEALENTAAGCARTICLYQEYRRYVKGRLATETRSVVRDYFQERLAYANQKIRDAMEDRRGAFECLDLLKSEETQKSAPQPEYQLQPLEARMVA